MRQLLSHLFSLSIVFGLCLPTGYAAEETPAEGAALPDETTQSLADLYKIQRTQAGALPMESRLRQQLPMDTTVLTLEVGDERFHALRQEADRAEPIGALLLLPDPGVDEGWVEQSAAIRFDLAQKGWLTLVMQPPVPDQPTLPERTLPVMKTIAVGQTRANGEAAGDQAPAEPAQASQTADSETPETGAGAGQPAPTAPRAPFGERFNERINLALEELREPPVEPVTLVAFGRSGPWAADFIANNPQLNLDLVLVDPLPASAADGPALGTLWAQLSNTRIIDIYHDPLPGYPRAGPDARVRRAAARRAEVPGYYQSRIATPFTGWRDEMPWLSRKLRGLLESRILQPMADAKRLENNVQSKAQRELKPGTIN
jgi:hypothetical protein